MALCVHRWRIPSPPAAPVGRCAHCGTRRSFNNAEPEVEWGRMPLALRELLDAQAAADARDEHRRRWGW